MLDTQERHVGSGEAVVPVMVISGPVGVGKTTTACKTTTAYALSCFRWAAE
jgi:flagellar biosynthesis GTPase FlhF